jgi:flagella synthesis protein FlgN
VIDPQAQSRLAELAERAVRSLSELSAELDREEEALRLRTADKVSDAVADKVTTLRELEVVTGDLVGLMRQCGVSVDRKGLATLTEYPRLADSGRRLEALLDECHGKNHRNGALIEFNRSLAENLFALVRGEPAGTRTYGRQGRMASAPQLSSSQTIAKA